MFRITYILNLSGMPSLIDAGIIEMTIPDKPGSCFQGYRLTGKGKKILAICYGTK